MHKTFISFYNKDIRYKDILVQSSLGNFIDKSVADGDISDFLTDELIRKKIRDEYLRDSTVTILLCGNETKHRKHVDWELYSSMHDGVMSKKSAIIVVVLPGISCSTFVPNAFKQVYNRYYNIDNSYYTSHDTSRVAIEEAYAPLPSRIKDQLENSGCSIPIISWNFFIDNLEEVIDIAYNVRNDNIYNLKAPMRRRNS